MPIDEKVLYYPIWIAIGRQDDPISFGRPCDTAAGAAAQVKARVRSGAASMGLVARFSAGSREPMESSVYPESARKIIRHWLDIDDSLAERDERDAKGMEEGTGPWVG